MLKQNTEEYAKGLIRANGLEGAIKLASECAENSDSDVPIYLPKDKRKAYEKEYLAAAREIKKVHGFWVNVLGILRKHKHK